MIKAGATGAVTAECLAPWELVAQARMLASERAPGGVRRLISVIAEQEGLSGVVETTAQLLATELVTNSCRAYAAAGMRGGVAVSVDIACGELCVSVADRAPGVPVLFPFSADGESGLGLPLVDSMSREWSWSGCSGRKFVWFSLTLNMPEPEPDVERWAELEGGR